MNLFNTEYTILNIIAIFIIIVMGLLLSKREVKRYNSKIIYWGYFMHLSFSILYYFFALYNTADANGYYNKALEQRMFFDNFETGTKAIVFIAALFVKYLLFTKFTLFILFGLFGYIGFIYLMRLLEPSKIKFLGIPSTIVIIFLPGFHFWTAALGKDSIVFMALMLFFYAIKNITNNKFILLISFLIITAIRPYLSGFILIAILFAIFTTKVHKIKKKYIFILAITIVTFIIILPFLKEFLNLGSFDINSLIDRSEYYNSQGAKQISTNASYIDVSNYNIINKMIAYFFRPLFFDAHSIIQFVASLENFILLLFFIKWLFSINFKLFTWFKFINIEEKMMLYFALIGWFVMASSMYNLGLASRQKYMFIPFFLILFSKQLKLNYARKR